MYRAMHGLIPDQLNMDHLDPVKRKANGLKPRHLVWSLLWTFRFEIFMTCEPVSAAGLS
jgi:hypothetical protein